MLSPMPIGYKDEFKFRLNIALHHYNRLTFRLHEDEITVDELDLACHEVGSPSTQDFSSSASPCSTASETETSPEGDHGLAVSPPRNVKTEPDLGMPILLTPSPRPSEQPADDCHANLASTESQ